VIVVGVRSTGVPETSVMATPDGRRSATSPSSRKTILSVGARMKESE